MLADSRDVHKTPHSVCEPALVELLKRCWNRSRSAARAPIPAVNWRHKARPVHVHSRRPEGPWPDGSLCSEKGAHDPEARGPGAVAQHIHDR